MLDPELGGIDGDTAIETVFAFAADIHRIALRDYFSRLGGEPPILLTTADVADHPRDG